MRQACASTAEMAGSNGGRGSCVVPSYGVRVSEIACDKVSEQ